MRRKGVGELRHLIQGQLGALDLTRKVAEHTAPLVWDEVVGDRIASVTEVVGIDRGVLRVSAKSAAWAQELTFHKEAILDRLNRRLQSVAPGPIVTDIRFLNRGIGEHRSCAPVPEVEVPPELDPHEREAIEQSFAEIVDPGMRSRLITARIADRRLHRWRIANGWAPCPRCGDLIPPWGSGHDRECPRCRLLR